jgi:hypothetical protein
MQQVYGMFQDTNGRWDIEIQNGKIVKENIYSSYLKHNFLCFGRGDRNIVELPEYRRGTIQSLLSNKEYFSQAWIYFLEGNITLENINKIIQEVNIACQRDKRLGLIDKNIEVKSVIKLDKNKLSFTYVVGSEEQNNIIIEL